MTAPSNGRILSNFKIWLNRAESFPRKILWQKELHLAFQLPIAVNYFMWHIVKWPVTFESWVPPIVRMSQKLNHAVILTKPFSPRFAKAACIIFVISFYLLFVVLPIWIKDTFTCKNSSRQAIIRLCARKRGSVWREIGYRLLYCLLMTPAIEMPKQKIERWALDFHILNFNLL